MKILKKIKKNDEDPVVKDLRILYTLLKEYFGERWSKPIELVGKKGKSLQPLRNFSKVAPKSSQIIAAAKNFITFAKGLEGIETEEESK